MSFTWPEIPFTGAEVEAFVIAYKELVESIYANWDGESLAAYQDYPGYAGSQLKEPFTNKETVKKLMESGLLYAAFIMKQRSGGSGPRV
jgi:hypothetical protein